VGLKKKYNDSALKKNLPLFQRYLESCTSVKLCASKSIREYAVGANERGAREIKINEPTRNEALDFPLQRDNPEVLRHRRRSHREN
jgi:hypothetical protein